MIPAGTGIKNYKDIKLFDDTVNDLDIKMNEILERRRLEEESEAVAEEPSYDTEESD
jgi:DNA-directed RNA polymerase subunit beta'